ncbi:Rho guanine nucleotide exchange factor 37 [Sciurus carolinensis]|uniref:Rho guanine nucleotide exchange factor 37 n=1 Tax=Sciurus carolinensis TaxID=30640 RepID=A0AA41SZD9_SCICA|nr:Rho guanine nucleotide exchange factor 37 [Sciurus carolinensis]
MALCRALRGLKSSTSHNLDASKYTRVEPLSLRERLARINTHTLSKKTTRLSQLLKQEAGLVSRTEDKEFDDLEERFQWVSLCVTELKNNVAAYLDNLENLIKKRLDKLLDFERVEEKLLEVGSVTYEEEAARHTYQALNSLLVAELPQFSQLVMQWLGQILRTFVALQKDLAEQVLQRAEGCVAQLPHHHLSEPAFRKLVEDTLGQTGNQLHVYRENFEKVLPPPTAQPLLPGSERQVQALLSRYGPGKLYQVTSNISGTGTLDLTLPRGQIVALLQNKDTKGNSNRWLVDTGGHRGYVPAGKLQLYHVVPSEKELRGQAGPRQDSQHPTPEPPSAPVCSVPAVTQPLLPGSERQVQALLSRYGPGKLYQVTSNISGTGTLDLTLPRGQIVALLQNKDTKGNSNRWLVDTGGHRGYVPAGKLQLYHVVPSEKELRGQAGPHQDSQHPTPEPPSAPVCSVPAVTQVVAVYPFAARSSHEVSLQAGQPVTVLEAQDKKGNPEWSLVEVNGQRGYVPSSFLARAPSPAPWGWTLPS